eukprot:comp11820_c0_seq1/m.6442 comp11820_c0_seq1/g.6442  ORF comp11820_c0_seq1/g.6442 comp11820_c0_seq1/m.6442 type:complete len:153 (-) comp11820_c0_seq1:726-1184(-)
MPGTTQEGLRPLLQQLLDVQSERAMNYMLFDRGYQEYLATRPTYDFDTYRQLVHHITENFNELSQKVIEVKQQLSDMGRADLAETVGKLQELEKYKLQLTVEHQLASKEYLDEVLLTDDKPRDIKRRLGLVVGSIAQLADELKDEMPEGDEQ